MNLHAGLFPFFSEPRKPTMPLGAVPKWLSSRWENL